MVRANALLVIPEGQHDTTVGTLVSALILNDPAHQEEPGF
jgi:hypothetical protein